MFSSIFILLRSSAAGSRSRDGYTLIELMIGVGIVGILMAIAVPSFATFRNRSEVSQAVSDLQMITFELSIALETDDRLPDSLADLNLHTLKDPWGNPYQYLKIQGVAEKDWKGKARKDRFMVPVNTDYDLYSMGPDGASQSPFTAKASRDDIVRANDGGFFGEAEDF